MVGHSQRAVADLLSGCGHFRKSIVCVRCAQGMRVQVCNHLHGTEKPLLFCNVVCQAQLGQQFLGGVVAHLLLAVVDGSRFQNDG